MIYFSIFSWLIIGTLFKFNNIIINIIFNIIIAPYMFCTHVWNKMEVTSPWSYQYGCGDLNMTQFFY
jgi:hypothetical protein